VELFLLFVNDVADLFVDMDISWKLYADDIKLYSYINTTLSREHLNYAINKLYEWSNVWQLKSQLTNVLSVTSILAIKNQILIYITMY